MARSPLPYPFEGKDMADEVLIRARQRMEETISLPRHHIDKETVDRVFREVPELLSRLKNW